MAYATVNDVTSRMTRTLSESEQVVCSTLLKDASILIDAYNKDACPNAKQAVACRMVIRALGDGETIGVPLGSTQGSMSALGYSQSWTIGSGGGAGELYVSKSDKKMLGAGDRVGSYSPTQELVGGDVWF